MNTTIMNTKKLLLLPAFFVACAFSVGMAANAQENRTLDERSLTDRDTLSQQQSVQDEAKPSSAHPEKVSNQELKKKVTNINKASTFIGMDVENLQGETLGEIDDLAFDAESGKIAYAVLSVGGFLGINEKYIAVPLNALTPAPGADHLLLDANKQRLERAPGFAKNKWPDLDTPAWGAATGFARTRTTPPEAAGRPGQSAQQQGTARAQYDASAQTDQKHFTGAISKVDEFARTLTVKGTVGDKTFHIDDSAQISTKNETDAEIDELKVGSQVNIQYTEEGDKAVAKAVRAQDPGATPDTASETEKQE